MLMTLDTWYLIYTKPALKYSLFARQFHAIPIYELRSLVRYVENYMFFLFFFPWNMRTIIFTSSQMMILAVIQLNGYVTLLCLWPGQKPGQPPAIMVAVWVSPIEVIAYPPSSHRVCQDLLIKMFPFLLPGNKHIPIALHMKDQLRFAKVMVWIFTSRSKYPTVIPLFSRCSRFSEVANVTPL